MMLAPQFRANEMKMTVAAASETGSAVADRNATVKLLMSSTQTTSANDVVTFAGEVFAPTAGVANVESLRPGTILRQMSLFGTIVARDRVQ